MSPGQNPTLTHRNSRVLTFQLQQEIQDWSKSHAELSEQIKSFEKSQRDIEVALTQKDDYINVSLFCKYMLGVGNFAQSFRIKIERLFQPFTSFLGFD